MTGASIVSPTVRKRTRGAPSASLRTAISQPSDPQVSGPLICIRISSPGRLQTSARAIQTLVRFIAPGAFSLRFLAPIYLGFLELMLLNAVVVFYSTCVSPILAAVFTLATFAVGHLSESIRDFGQMQGTPFQQTMADVVYYLLPNLEVFNMRAAVVHGDSVPPEHLLMATVYGLSWTALLLLLGSAIFARRELRG